MTANTKNVLIKARDLLKDEARWTQDAFARNPGGRSVHSKAEDACAWCSVGAVRQVSAFEEWDDAESALTKAAGMVITAYNDDQYRTHDEVLRVFDKAIQATP